MTDPMLIDRPEAYPGVVTLRFNRPDKKNAITRAMYRTMADTLTAANGDDSVRALVILGTPGCFTAGNDLADFMAVAVNGGLGAEVLAFLDAMARLEKPLLAAVDGLAIGIGATLQLHCDLTFASPRAMFKTPFVDLALVPEAGSSLLGPQIMGHQRAFAMFAMGEAFSAEEARAAGLIYKVVAEDSVEAEALAAAARLAAKPPQALKIARALLRKSDGAAVIARIAEEAEHFSAQLRSDEAKAAFQAFFQRKSG